MKNTSGNTTAPRPEPTPSPAPTRKAALTTEPDGPGQDGRSPEDVTGHASVPALSLDPARYRDHLARFDLTDAQANELLATLWDMMRTCVEWGFEPRVCEAIWGAGACGAPDSGPGTAIAKGPREAVECGHHQENDMTLSNTDIPLPDHLSAEPMRWVEPKQ